MTNEQKEKMEAHLKKIGFEMRCPIFNGGHWNVGGIMAGPTLGDDKAVHHSEVIPVVSLFCDVCGYMVTFSAV